MRNLGRNGRDIAIEILPETGRPSAQAARTLKRVAALPSSSLDAPPNRAYVGDLRRRYRVRGSVQPHHAGVIARTGFSTWEFLLDDEFMGRGLIWPKHLSAVFRGAWPSHQAGVMLAHARDLVATLRDFRNRLFHHEPTWKRYGVRTEADALQHLQEKIGVVESLLALIHPENLRLLQANRAFLVQVLTPPYHLSCMFEIGGGTQLNQNRSSLLRDAHRACTAGEIRRFQHLAQIHKVNSLNAATAVQAAPVARPASAPLTRVALAYIEQHFDLYLRFGEPARIIQLDCRRRCALFLPGAMLCRIRWQANAY